MARFSKVAATIVLSGALAGSTLVSVALPVSSGAAGGVGGTLYFSRDEVSELYTLDTTSGTATLIGTTGTSSSTIGLSEGPDDGVLLGSGWEDLARINADGSGFTQAGTDALLAEGLAFDPTSNTLYRTWGGAFSTADPSTGAHGPELDGPGEDLEGLAWRDDGTVLGLSRDSDTLFAYDIAAGSWSEVGATGIENNDDWGLAWNPSLDVLYAVNTLGELYSIDPDSADATLIGDTGLDDEGRGGGGLAFLTGAPAVDNTLVPGEPVGDAGSDVTFPVAGLCGEAAGNPVSLSISGPDGAEAGPVETTTGEGGVYEAELVVPDAPAGEYTITGTCTVVGGPTEDLPEGTVVLGAAQAPPSQAPVPVPADPDFTG